jgi:hypothetical protein
MSNSYYISRTGRNAADAATANLTTLGGFVVLDSAADPLACHVPAAAEVAAPGTVANKPLGVVEVAENALGGRVTICVHGVVTAIAGAAGIAAGTRLVSYDATGALIAHPLPAAGVNQWAVGDRIADENGLSAIAAGGNFKMFVNPQLTQGA